jgi:hypothetical protein
MEHIMDTAVCNLTPPSPFHNLCIGEIVDQLGHAKAALADAHAAESALKAELIARGVTEAEGALFRATVTSGSRWTLNADAIRKELGELWVVSHSKVTTVTTVRVAARTGSRAAA